MTKRHTMKYAKKIKLQVLLDLLINRQTDDPFDTKVMQSSGISEYPVSRIGGTVILTPLVGVIGSFPSTLFLDNTSGSTDLLFSHYETVSKLDS